MMLARVTSASLVCMLLLPAVVEAQRTVRPPATTTTPTPTTRVETQLPCCQVVNVQPDPIEPCCNIVTVRNLATSELFAFKADALDRTAIEIGQPITADLSTGRVTGIAGVARSYAVFEPAWGAPCCGVVNVQPDPVTSCCEIVTVRHLQTGRQFQFQVPQALAAQWQAGAAVSLNSSNSLASVQSPATTAGPARSYGFPVIGDPICPAEEADHWSRPAAPPTGRVGGLRVAPPGAGFGYVTVYRPGETQKLGEGEIGQVLNLSAGEYDVELGGVRIANVPLTAGCETRLRAGVLSVNVSGSWSLHDEAGQWVQAGASEAKRLALPVGRYQMRTGLAEETVEIRDNQTTDF